MVTTAMAGVHLSVRRGPARATHTVVRRAGRRHRPGAASEPGPAGHDRGGEQPTGRDPRDRPGTVPRADQGRTSGVRGRAKSPRMTRCDSEHTPRTPDVLGRIPSRPALVHMGDAASTARRPHRRGGRRRSRVTGVDRTGRTPGPGDRWGRTGATLAAVWVAAAVL